MTNSASTIVPHLLSAGLFVVTALASQWLQHHMKKDEIKRTDNSVDGNLQQSKVAKTRKRQQRHLSRQAWQDEEDPENELSDHDAGYREDNETENEAEENDELEDRPSFQEYYSLSRTRRLSFDELRPVVNEAEMSISPFKPSLKNPSAELQQLRGVFLQENSFPRATAKYHLQPQESPAKRERKARSPSPHRRQKQKPHRRNPRLPRSSIIDHEDEYDFLPKNSNWNHFEQYNEDDISNGLVSPDSAQPVYRPQNHFPPPFSNHYNNTYYDESARPKNYESEQHSGTMDEKDPQSESESSAEQFVWTDAIHKKRPNSERPPPASSPAPCPMDPKEVERYQQPVAAPTQEGSIHAELPGFRPRRRLVNNDDDSTHRDRSRDRVIQGSNLQREPPVLLERSDYPPANQHQQRQFLRHASSSINSSIQNQGACLPQRLHLADRSNHSSTHERSWGRTASEESRDTRSSDLSSSSHRRKHKNPSSKRHRSARAEYNAKIMPNKLVMIRHGESMGNINEELYSTTPDNQMPLTKLGWEQARKAGQHLRQNVLASGESVHFIVSPYVRTVETFHGIVSAWCDPNSTEFSSIPNREMRLKAWYGRLLEMGLTWHEDPRIREQDFGNYQDPETIRKAKRDRHNFGVFYYRFPHGESASDVFDRVSTFLDSLWRSFDMNRSRNYVLVTHGISIRVLLARYFRYTIHQFNMLANPRNCEMIALGHDGHGRLRLEGRYQLHLKGQPTKFDSNGQDASEKSNEEEKEKAKATGAESDRNGFATEVDEYKFYKRLRILPQAAIRKVHIRISYDDAAK